ncbi:MAG: hypothetical protein QXQ84_02900 [Nitrososphaerota archaeon]
MLTVYIETDKINVSPSETFSAKIIVDLNEKGVSAVDIVLSLIQRCLGLQALTKAHY